MLTAGIERVKCGIGSQHAGFDRGMATLDATGVQKASFAANQCATREGELGQGLQATRGDGTSAIRDTFAAFKEFADFRVGFVTLKFFIRRQIRVFVGETNHIADRDLIVFQMIEEGTTVSLAVEWPAGRVDD